VLVKYGSIIRLDPKNCIKLEPKNFKQLITGTGTATRTHDLRPVPVNFKFYRSGFVNIEKMSQGKDR
jgi:hypothetical protein